MRLSQGAGCVELSGLEEISKRENYNLIRPLLNCTKDELLNYLKSNGHKYFIDSSNSDTKYRRNRFRPLANELLKEGKFGFIKSFDILNFESSLIKNSFQTVVKEKSLRILKLKERFALPYAVSYTLKELGYLLSGKERDALKRQNSMVIGRIWAVEYVDNLLYIAPYIQCKIPKEIRESYRIKKIPPKVRGYIYQEGIEVSDSI